MSFINFYGMYLFGGNKNQINPLKSMGQSPGSMLFKAINRKNISRKR